MDDGVTFNMDTEKYIHFSVISTHFSVFTEFGSGFK